MFKAPQQATIHVAGVFALLLLTYHLIFREYFPLPNGMMGHDYVLTLGGFLDGYLWYRNNGFLTPPWFTPSFCGGQAFFADPQSAFYSIPQFLTFIVDPLQAVYWAFLIFAALGFWGMYLYARKCLQLGRLPALVAATVFMFNGFYAHRMMVGHYGYQAFMLVPLVAYLLLKAPTVRPLSATSLYQSLLAGLLIAYWFHSGLTTLMIPAALAVLALACLMAIHQKISITKIFLSRSLLAAIPVMGLSASKLNANLTLISNFARDYYPLPGISDIGGLLTFVFQSLFYSSQHVYQTVTPLWKNIQWAAMPHELAFGLTPIPLVVFLIGTAAYILKRQSPSDKTVGPSASSLLAGFLLAITLLMPLALLYYTPEWNAILKELPLVGSTTSPFRWLIIYIPLIAALTGLATKMAGKFGLGLTIITLLGIPLLNSLENREYYQQQNYNPAPVVSFYNAVVQGKITPRISEIGDPRHENGEPAIDNNLFLSGISPIRCYNPLYGYRLEKLNTNPLKPGPVESSTTSGYLNLHNPACLVFPTENNCRPWDTFSNGQTDQLRDFTDYRPYSFEKGDKQHWADLITSGSLLSLLILGLGIVIHRYKNGQTPTISILSKSIIALVKPPSLTGLVMVVIAITWLIVFMITRWVTPNGLTAEGLIMVKEIFLPWPQFFQPEPRERTAYLLTITLFPAIAILVTVLLSRANHLGKINLSSVTKINRGIVIGNWLLILLISTVVFAASEAPFGKSFGFSSYTPVIAFKSNQNPIIFLIIFVAAYFLFFREIFTQTAIQSPRLKKWLTLISDITAIGLIAVISARISFIPESTGALEWTPDLVHMAPLFETAAIAYLTSATAGADMISQYGGLVEFARPILWLLDGDPLALMWFTYIAMAGAVLAQWLALRRVTGSAIAALLGIGAIFFLTGVKFMPFACFQCVHFRWFWPSIFLCLAAFYSTSTQKSPYLPYFLFPIAIYWNPETGLASAAAWIGWRLIANVVPVMTHSAETAKIRSVMVSAICPAFGVGAGIFLVALYVATKSGQLLDIGLMSRFAKDFYLYGFYMLPMPSLHLWTIYAVIAGTLLVIGIQNYARTPQSGLNDGKNGFLVFAVLLFSLLFAYYQGRSFYGNLLAISYPLWLAIIVWLYSYSESPASIKKLLTTQPLKAAGLLVISIGFAASLTTSFYLRPINDPFSKHDLAEKANLKSWVEKTAAGRTPLFISFSAWRLMLITETSHNSGTAPVAALLRKDQLQSYLAELQNPKYALYYDLTNDIYFSVENIVWVNQLRQVVKKITDYQKLKPVIFENNQGRLVLLNPIR